MFPSLPFLREDPAEVTGSQVVLGTDAHRTFVIWCPHGEVWHLKLLASQWWAKVTQPSTDGREESFPLRNGSEVP